MTSDQKKNERPSIVQSLADAAFAVDDPESDKVLAESRAAFDFGQTVALAWLDGPQGEPLMMLRQECQLLLLESIEKRVQMLKPEHSDELLSPRAKVVLFIIACYNAGIDHVLEHFMLAQIEPPECFQ